MWLGYDLCYGIYVSKQKEVFDLPGSMAVARLSLGPRYSPPCWIPFRMVHTHTLVLVCDFGAFILAVLSGAK